MGNFHPKVQAVIDSQIAESTERITLLEAKLAQLEKFESQKATLEESMNALIDENASLRAELQKVTEETVALKEAIDKANQDLSAKATSEPTTITVPHAAEDVKEEPKSAPEVKDTPVDDKAAKKAAKKEDNKK